MYTETQQVIRNSLWNFMGSIMNASISEENKKENVTALISEELCKFCKTGEDTIDMKAAKPMLKAVVWILKARKLELYNLPITSEAIDNTIKELETLETSLGAYVDRI